MTPWLLAAALAADEGDDNWDISAPHGEVREVALDLDEGTWVSVSVHGGRVAFDLLGDIWVVPLSGGVATRVTEGPAWDVQPVFSPDGTRIAFTSDRGGNENIWLMDADGTGARAFTEEEEARCTHPVWDPTGPYLLYRRRTVDTRSIGVTELWQRHLQGGDGFALTKLDEHPHAGEPWVQGPYVYFSSRHGRFEYDANPVRGLWEVVRLDRRTGDLRTVAHGPGSASRPTVAGDALFFVSRRRATTLLERLDLRSGERTVVADWLSPDELEGFALHGTYPRIDVAPDGALVLWANGYLWRVDPETGNRARIPFRAQGTWGITQPARPTLEIPDTFQAKVIRWPTLSARGSWAFSALGQLWVKTPNDGPQRLSEGTGYAPAWSPDGEWLAWTSWSDGEGGRLHVTGPDGRTEALDLRGQLTNPAWSDDGEALVVLRGVGGGTSVDLASEPWYEAVLVERDGKNGWNHRVITAVDQHWGSRKQRLRLRDGRLYLLEWHGEPLEAERARLVSVALDGSDKRVHLELGEAEEAAISPDFTRIAYKLRHQLHVAALPPFARDLDVAGLPSAQVTRIVGDWLSWTPDGSEVTWVEGPVLKRLPVAGVWDEQEEEDEADPLAEDPRVVSEPAGVVVPRARPEGALVLRNARAITMAGDEVLDGVDILIEGDRIAAIGRGIEAPRKARQVDLGGRTVLPGLIDVHAHLHFSSGDILPEQEWRYLVALDYGVTTVQDPSTLTDLVFTQKERVEAGLMQGPRVFSTGGVLYGALSPDNAPTASLDDARAHVRRLKAVGATSVKVYQQSARTQRQWYLQACAEEGLLCVPEGGGDLWMDLGMVLDGYPALEHSLPAAPLHRDVIELFAASDTFYTPTLQVAYGGLGAQHFFRQHHDAVDDPWLRRHFPPRQLEADLWRLSVTAHEEDWRFRRTAADAAAIRAAGGHVTLGSHGELQGLGVHWELQALGGPGALSAHDALRAATIEGARYIGLEAHLGSIEPGKLADLLVVDGDPLADLANAAKVHLVVKNGEIVVER